MFGQYKFGIAAVAVVGVTVIFLLVFCKPYRPRYKRRPLMTGNELEFYGRLVKALPGLHVFPQVALHALMVPVARSSKTWQSDFWRISQKVVDFALFDAGMHLVAVVELDDRTHKKSNDALRDSYLKSAQINTIRFESRNKPTEQEIRSALGISLP